MEKNRKSNSTAPKELKSKRGSSKSVEDIIRGVDEWVSEAIMRERCGEKVFKSRDRADILSNICGVSKRYVLMLRKEQSNDTSKSDTRGRKKIKLDDFETRALSRLVLGYYRRNPPEIPTVDKIHEEAQEIPGFPQMSKETLRRRLKELGFAYKKRNKKLQIYQRNDIVAQRHYYLQRIMHLRSLGYKVFYQDETWCNANHTKEYVWQLQDDKNDLLTSTVWKGGLNVPCGSGKRLIINHIGSEEGFLEGCGECFIGKKNSSDYHHEMNGVHFERWWKDIVLPRLPDKSVVVIDNAKYHSRQTEDSKKPTTAWRKAQIVDWLQKKSKTIDSKYTKPQLLQKSKEIPVQKEYVLEEITKNFCSLAGKSICLLRLPIAHSELNPIELIWALVKSEVARKNVSFKISDVKELMTTALDNVKVKSWSDAITHTTKIEKTFWQVDIGETCSPIVDSLVIALSESDDEFESSSEEED